MSTLGRLPCDTGSSAMSRLGGRQTTKNDGLPHYRTPALRFLKILRERSGQNSLNALPPRRARNPKPVRDNAQPTVPLSGRQAFDRKLLAGMAMNRAYAGWSCPSLFLAMKVILKTCPRRLLSGPSASRV